MSLTIIAIIAVATTAGVPPPEHHSDTTDQPSCQAQHHYTRQDLESLDPLLLEQSAVFADKKLVGEIETIRQDIFPNTSHSLYKKANRWHTLTMPRVILAILPFKGGEWISADELKEAERLLRQRSYFFDAKILVDTQCGDVVNIDVVVREVWTLNPTLSFSRSGSENEYEIGVADSNWRGTGKQVLLEVDRSTSDTGITLAASDALVADKLVKDASISVSEDSKFYRIGLNKPFYALDTKKAYGLNASYIEDETELSLLGRDVVRFDTTTKNLQLHAGHVISSRSSKGTSRLLYGVRMASEDVHETQLLSIPMEQSEERKFIYPYVAWSRQDDTYLTASNFHNIGVVEDILIGWQLYAEAGLSSKALSSTSSNLHLNLRATKSWRIRNHHLLSASAALVGRLDSTSQSWENTTLDLRLNYLHTFSEIWKTFLAAETKYGKNLHRNAYFQLGGSSGLRGYPNNYLAGDRIYKLTIEQRRLTQLEPFQLFRVAYVGFVDVGHVEFSRYPFLPAIRQSPRTIANVGVGLRLESIRTGRGHVIHLDLAQPLVTGPRVSGVEFSVTIKGTL